MIERWTWLGLSSVGAIFYGVLLYKALGDLRYRKGQDKPLRSNILLGWQRVVFDGVLCLVMALDCLLALLSLSPGNGTWIILGLIGGKLALVLLGIYLAWNRAQTNKAAKSEMKPKGTK